MPSTDPISVVIIEDDPMVLEVNIQYVGTVEGFRVIGTAGTAREGLERIQSALTSYSRMRRQLESHCGEKHKKPLKQRVHECTCGVVMQRDLYSAYLARFVEDDALHATKPCQAWSGAESLLRAAWRNSQQLASGKAIPASFGVFRSQSESSEKENKVHA